MKSILSILALVCVTLLLSTAGCVITDVDTEIPSDPTRLDGDWAAGIWEGVDRSTFEGSGTGIVWDSATTYTFTIMESGYALLDVVRTEHSEDTDRYIEFSDEGVVSKAENVYTIETYETGTFVLTILDEGVAELTTPSGSLCSIEKISS